MRIWTGQGRQVLVEAGRVSGLNYVSADRTETAGVRTTLAVISASA